MTFLNSALLAALTLGLLPILIHLLNRQRYKDVDFPTLRFLRELQRQKMRQVKIRQILLLILRTLAVIFLVFALTRPVLKSAAGILPGADARTSAVVIVDRSASMQTETPDGSRFRQVQSRAQEILAMLGDGDDAQIVWADETPERFPEQATGNIGLLRETIGDARVSERGGNLVSALQAARAILGQSQNLHKEVYLLSDFSASAWPEPLPQSAILPDDVRLFLCPVGTDKASNVGIVEANVTSRIITPGRAVEVTFSARNTGNTEAADRIVSVYLGGRRVTQTRVTLAPGELKTSRVKFVPEDPGDQVGYVTVEEADDFSSDNQRYFVLRVPARLRVAVVGSDGPARELTALALNPGGQPGGFVETTRLTPGEFENNDWADFDAVFLLDAAGFSGGFGARLHSYVEAGRGVFVMFGNQADLRSYSAWLPAIGLPVPADPWQAESNPVKWSQLDLAHPLFEGVFEERPADISPEIRRMVRTSSTGTAVKIISASNEIPFLWESRVGKGHALMLTSSPDPEWSTLFRTGIFPPLVVSSAAYLAGIGTSGAEYQLTVGVPAQIEMTGTPGDAAFEIRSAHGALAPTVETSAFGFALKVPAIAQPDAAELWHGNRRVAALAVNLPPRESELQPQDAQEFKSWLGGQLTTLAAREAAQPAIQEGRYGRELWKLCLIIALAALIAEMLLGRVGKREAIAV
ncbi:BatA domain-containing protein [candidate division KSB1 bacterium]|nr:BatA domain-containing protein [candidate division KSB1 bacterium]